MNATQNRCDNSFIFSLLLILLFVMIPATSQADIQCYQCHGTSTGSDYRPIDAVSRNYSSGGFMGNHRSHMAAPASPITCRKCHNNQDYTSNHRNGFINFSSNINSSPLKGKYIIGGSPVTSKTQNVTPVLGTCTDVNCHFEAVTPQWGTELFTAPTDCDKCHGAPPSGGATGASGSHAKHDQYYSGTANCQKCHSNNTTFQHATSAGKRNLNISFAAAPNNGFGAYSGALNDYLPSQTNAFGKCTATYCHSNGTKVTAPFTGNKTATWGGVAHPNCTGCHRSNAASGEPISTGSHSAHVYRFIAGYHPDIACVKCHAATANSSMAIVNPANHVDKQVTVAFNNTSSAAAGSYNGQPATPASPSMKAPGPTLGQCANVYCHSSGQGNGGTWPPTYQTPTWGTSATGECGTCHGIQTKHDALSMAIGTPTPLTSGSHSRHLLFELGTGNVSSERKCAACHAYTLTGYSPNSCNSTTCHGSTIKKHANYEINVGIPTYYGVTATYNAASLTPGTGYSTCSNVYCHSDGMATPATYRTPTWGDVASGACGTCHGVTAAAPPTSVPHLEHMGAANQYRYACAECHSGKVQVTTDSTVAPAFTNLTSHVDKLRNVKFDASNAFGTYSTATQSCRNLYCHSTGNTSVAAGNLPAVYNGKVYARQTWSGTVACNSCHGRSTSNGMPDYANAGAVGSATANSHQKHVTSSALACVECHEKTTKSGTTIRSAIPSKHVDGTNHDVFFNLSGLNKNGTYDDSLKKCSNTYCHGIPASLAWGGTTTCASCHDATGSGSPVLALRHDKHYNSATAPSVLVGGTDAHTATAYVFSCLNCHPSNQHATGPASTVAPLQDAALVGTKITAYTKGAVSATDTKGYNYTNNGTCTTVCHTRDGVTAGSAITPSPAWNGANAAGCGYCHNKAGDAGPVWSAPHTKHINTYSANTNITCASCHAGTATSNSAIGASGRNQHPNANRDLAMNAFASGATVTIAGAQGSQSCANTYCHSPGTTLIASSATHTAVSWSGNTTCVSCHSGGTTTGPGYVNNSLKTNSHNKHTVAASNINSVNLAYVCVDCHAATVDASNAITDVSKHVNKVYDISGSRITTYSYVSNGGTCSTSCHGKTTPKWGESSTGCNFCHPYDVGSWNLSSQRWTSQLSPVAEGFGAHEKHIAHIKGLVGIAGSMNLLAGFGAAGSDATTVCGACHTKALANHIEAGNARSINFADGAYTYGIGGFGLSFGGNPSYGGTSASSSSVNPKNCLNTSCHTGTAPVWAPY